MGFLAFYFASVVFCLGVFFFFTEFPNFFSKTFLSLKIANKLLQKKKFRLKKASKYEKVAKSRFGFCIQVQTHRETTFSVALRYFDSRIFSFSYDKRENKIVSFECHDNQKIKENEVLVLELIQNIIHYYIQELSDKKNTQEKLFDFFNGATISMKNEQTNSETPVLPFSIQSLVHEIESLAQSLLLHKNVIDFERTHYLTSCVQERIPLIKKQFLTLPLDKQKAEESNVIHTLTEVKDTFTEWKSDLEQSLSDDLTKQLKTLTQVIHN